MRMLTALFFVVGLSAAAQPYEVPQVPHKLNFAGITLTIRDDARREIQKDVDALWQSPRHFNIKVERAKTYFPIIEKIFVEERVPDDFKFLVLQESALIADAVSVSDAVGFWQFKDFTAMEMGLRVDDQIDERMNIASASRGAAQYIKKNNYRFNNWVYALQAYQMGAGGVLRSVIDVESGTKHMTITSETYWYVKKFLAHKIAFEKAVGGKAQQPVSTYESDGAQSINDLATKLAVPAEELLAYNKWIRKGSIPGDRTYAIVVPLPADKLPTQSDEKAVSKTVHGEAKASALVKIFINGVPATKALPGETMTTTAKRLGLSLPSFMSYNDLQGFEKIEADNYYFLEKKKSKAEQSETFAKQGDNLWVISQRYGVSLKKLKKYNRTTELKLREGQAVWLSSRKPKDFDIKTAETQVTDDVYFNWGAEPAESLSTMEEVRVAEKPLVTVSTSESSSPSMPQEHIVKAGENLTTIARSYNLSLEDLIRWNQLGDNRELEAGQRLRLSENKNLAETVPPQVTVHEVKASDTLYSIARQYGITIKNLMEWNGKKDFTLSIGEKLTVYKNQANN
jgi:membrane-bound lytic murein transglycosylase D